MRAARLPSLWRGDARGRPRRRLRHGALREVIDDGRNGLLFARGDPSDLVRAIGWALAHREELAEIAVPARAQAASEFTVERMTRGPAVLRHASAAEPPSSLSVG